MGPVSAKFINFIMLALEGQRFVKLEPSFKEKLREDAENILYLIFNESTPEQSAQDVSEALSLYGDNYVVKDSSHTFFVEYSYYDEKLVTGCLPEIEQVKQLVMHEGIFKESLVGIYGYEESMEVRKNSTLK